MPDNTSVDLAKIARRVKLIRARTDALRNADALELCRTVEQLAMLYQASQDALTEVMQENTAKTELLKRIQARASSAATGAWIDWAAYVTEIDALLNQEQSHA